MKKKILSFLISSSLIFSAFPVTVAAVQKDDYFSLMTTEDKISQMIMPSFRYSTDEGGDMNNVTEITAEIETALQNHSYAGVILFGQNTPTNENTIRLVDSLQKANAKGGERPQLLISIDQEGGSITRLGQGTVTPGNMALGAANDLNITKESAAIIGSELSALGINVDFAPDVDINNNPANPVIGVRSFSDDAQTVAQQGAAYVETLNNIGVISTLKHFPGHGDTDTDSHTGLPCIDKSYDELKNNELIPFQACINAGCQMIMTAHIVYPQIETNTYISQKTGEEIYIPATLSKTIITDILRGDMGFEGVVTTDAMEMDAIAEHFDKYDAAKLAINAGVDILLMPVNPISKEDFAELETYVSTLAQMADNGEISMDNVNASVQRILTLKENNGLFAPYDDSDIEERVEYALNHVGTKEIHDKEWELAKKTITLVKNDNDTLPLTAQNQKTVVLVPYDDETTPMNYAIKKLTNDGKIPDGAVIEAYSYYDKTVDEVLPMTESADNIIFMSEMYSERALKNDTAKMADTLADTIHENGGKFIVMSVNLPYDVARFEKADAIMLTYQARTMREDPGDKVKEIQQYGPNMPAALYMMFSKDDAPVAKLPINIPQLDENYSFTDTVLYERGFGLTYATEEEKVIMAEHTNITWGRSGESIVIRTNSTSDTVAIRIGGGLVATQNTEGVTIENGTVTLSGELANAILSDGTNTLRIIFADGEIEITVNVTTEEEKVIMAEHTNITWGRSGESIVIRTNSTSDTVAIRIGGGLAATENTEGVTLENGTVILSGEFANTILSDGENTLKLIFADGEIEISIFVTAEVKGEESSKIKEEDSSEIKDEESSNNSVTHISDSASTPKTGESYPFFIIPIFMVSGFIAVFASKKKNRKDTF